MTVNVRAGAIVAIVMLACMAGGRAAELSPPVPAISIRGIVAHPQDVTLADLQKMPPVTVSVAFTTDKGTLKGKFTGALLSTVIAGAQPEDEPGKNAYLRHVYVIRARDGYAVALSQGEIDPRYGNETAILAYAQDGKPLGADDAVRLIVASDKHGGRAVRGVTAIDVR